MRLNPLAVAAILSLILSLGLAVRVNSQSRGFRTVVNQSLATSEGYDQKFIDLVTRLEDVLTTRAQFPYPGGRDPMTGRRREVATAAFEPQVPRQKSPPKPGPAPSAAIATAPEAPKEVLDNVRLTAIIEDDYSQHTAIVMNGERSLSVDVGDAIGNRKVTRITSKELTMEDDSTVYTYGLNGSRLQQRK